MTTIARAATAAVLLACVHTTGAAQEAALETGSALVGGSASATFQDVGADENLFQLSVVPRVEYFVSDGLSLGGQVGVSYSKVGDFTSTGLILGPALTYYFVRDGRTHPFFRGTANYVRTSFDSQATDETADSWNVGAAVGLLHMLGDAVGLDAQLFVERAFAESGVGPDNDRTRGGLRLGIAAFVI